MKEGFTQFMIPGLPLVEGGFHEGHIEFVCAVVHADGFGDVGGGGEGVGDGAGVEKGDGMAALTQFEGGGDAIDAGADDSDGGNRRGEGGRMCR